MQLRLIPSETWWSEQGEGNRRGGGDGEGWENRRIGEESFISTSNAAFAKCLDFLHLTHTLLVNKAVTQCVLAVSANPHSRVTRSFMQIHLCFAGTYMKTPTHTDTCIVVIVVVVFKHVPSPVHHEDTQHVCRGFFRSWGRREQKHTRSGHDQAVTGTIPSTHVGTDKKFTFTSG